MNRSDQRGRTLVEVVVVLLVVGVVLALVAAGLLFARDGVRRTTCTNNLRQLGRALQSYHQVHGMIPPAAIRDDANSRFDLKNLTSNGENYSMHKVYANWIMMLLPHLGQDELAASFNMNVPVTDPVNAKPRTTELSLMNCPSDAYSTADNHFRAIPVEGPESTFSRGNYAINGGVSGLKFSPGRPWAPAPSGTTRQYVDTGQGRVEQVWGSGVAGFNKSFSVQQFENGLSNLVGVDEVRAGLLADDSRGVWALGEVGASVTWGHGLLGDDSGPNCRHPRSDDVLGCNQAHGVFGEDGLVREGMPCCSYTRSEQATARSMHSGGVHVLMMDGSTRFVSDDVDLSIWHAIHSRETREVDVPVTCKPPTDSPAAESSSRPKSPKPKHPLPEDVESITNSIGMTLVRVPAGEFIMGLPDEGEDRDDPVAGVPPDVPPHRVRITEDFYLGAFEVTQGQYERVMASNPSWHAPEGGGRIEIIDQDHRQFPVEQVSWVDAATFCCRLSALPAEKAAGREYRLPTEAEWEYACRAGNTTPFRVPSGSSADVSGFNMRPDAPEGLPVRPVGSYRPNPFGLYDMRGNVFEWCADWYAWDYYAHSPHDDPPGPSSGVLRVVRGADWRFTNMGCHYGRFHTEPWRTNPYIGFRVVCEKGE